MKNIQIFGFRADLASAKPCSVVALAAGVLYASFAAGNAWAADPDSCQSVRFSDVGWTDITATTALTSTCLTLWATKA